MRKQYHLRSMPSAQCKVVFNFKKVDQLDEFESIEFYSYSTLVFRVSRVSGTEQYMCDKFCAPDYSRTTARHVNRFTTELFGVNQYFEFKRYDSIEVPVNNIINMCREYEQFGKRVF